ncbi:hypothetical protein [Longimicrobium sp.]|uniref:hypothetical protein n=1 Tax=Longimicrobium sp. TaxID=2029185 RepID=UPI003B3B7091
MPDSLETLDRLIDGFLAGSIPFATLESQFAPAYLFMPEDAFPDVETEVWYGVIHERIEWTSSAPSDEERAFGWTSIDEFRAWLQSTVQTRRPHPGQAPISARS